MRPPRPRSGMSLVELIVTIGIMSIVITGAFEVFSEGLRLFRTNQGATDAQSSAIKTLSRMNTELVNADPALIKYYPDPPGGPEIHGVVFASPLNDQGAAQFHPDTGKVFWQKYVCYYFVPDPVIKARGKLFRKEEPIATELGAPTGHTGDTRVSMVANGLGLRTTNYFASATNLPTRILGTAVSGLEITEFKGKVDDGNGVRDVLGGNSVTGRDFSLDVRLEAGDINNNGPDGYYIRVDSRVTPRG